jgi:Domain of unknown function (DUF4252)/Secretion system C-terminal sorting domain
MKQLLYAFVALSFLGPSLFAQNTMQAFIEKYKQKPNFSFAYITKDLYENATKFEVKEKDWKKVQQVVKDMGSLTILAADDLKNAKKVYQEAISMVSQTDMDELLNVRDGDEKVQIWVKDEGNNVSQLVLLVGESDEFVLVSFYGQIELTKLAQLGEILDADASEELVKTAAAVSIDFTISPNPVQNEFVLNYNNDKDQPVQLTVTDNNGRAITQIKTSGDAVQTLQMGDVPQGTYWVQLKTTQGKVGVRQIQVVK